jgi:hypothetical protein
VPDEWSTSHLKEHFEAILKAERERTDLIIAAADKALELQAEKYENRLENLNHEADRIKAAASVSVTRELFDARLGQIEDRIAAAKLRTDDNATTMRKLWIGMGMSLAVSLAAALIGWIFRDVQQIR